jgi:glycosyltransferase involved in cell wall biosynthesis
MGKKFFLVSQVFYPDEVSTAGLFTDLCLEIAKKNVEVEVWCGQPSYNTKKKQPKKLNYKGISIFYLPSSNFNKNKVIGRLLNYITFSISLSFKLLFSKSKNTIFASTNPPFLGFIVAFFCYLKNRKYNCIIHDVYPEGLIRVGKWSNKNPVVKIWNIVNRFSFKRSMKIITIGRDMQKLIVSGNPHQSDKVLYIPIWQNGNLITPTHFDTNEFVIKNNWQKKFIVQYSGNMGLWNDMKTFARAATELNHSDILFTFYGDGIRKKELMEEMGFGNNLNVIFFPFQPKEKLNSLLTSCHVALVSLAKNLDGIAVPSKIMGILAAGIPVIAMVPENSEIALIIQDNNCGIVLEPGDVKGLTKSIMKLKNDQELRKLLATNAKTAFDNYFNTPVVAEQYIQLL